MRISDWSSDVCSSDLQDARIAHAAFAGEGRTGQMFVEEEGGECLEHRHLDLDRTFAAPRARHQRAADAIDRMERRDLVDEDRRDEGERASGRAPQPTHPAGRLDDIQIGSASWRESVWQ